MGVALVLLAAALWGTVGPLARIAQRAGVEPLEVAFYRAALGGLLFALHGAATGSLRALRPRDVPPLALAGVLSLAGMYGAFQLSVRSGGAALASVLLYTAPAWVALLSRALFGERLTRAKVVAIALTVAGAGMLAAGAGGEHASGARVRTPAVLWGLAAGLCYALLYPVTRAYGARLSGSALFAVLLPAAALALAPFYRRPPANPTALAAVLALGALGTFGANAAYAAGLRRVEPTRAAVLASAEPVLTAALSFALFGERFRPLGYAGCALALVGVALMARAPGSSSERPRAPSDR